MCRNCVDGICQNKCVAPEPCEVNFNYVKPKVDSQEETKGKSKQISVKLIS